MLFLVNKKFMSFLFILSHKIKCMFYFILFFFNLTLFVIIFFSWQIYQSYLNHSYISSGFIWSLILDFRGLRSSFPQLQLRLYANVSFIIPNLFSFRGPIWSYGATVAYTFSMKTNCRSHYSQMDDIDISIPMDDFLFFIFFLKSS